MKSQPSPAGSASESVSDCLPAARFPALSFFDLKAIDGFITRVSDTLNDFLSRYVYLLHRNEMIIISSSSFFSLSSSLSLSLFLSLPIFFCCLVCFVLAPPMLPPPPPSQTMG